MLACCAGLAILSVLKVGAGWSCGLGTGLVVARRANGSWSAPSSILSVSAGTTSAGRVLLGKEWVFVGLMWAAMRSASCLMAALVHLVHHSLVWSQ